ncbi:ABC transporter substrate-binding protein [Prosthecobacter sp.]|uniref:ABC transporter substrate-binding protein n=1 Tax=Prosthecobacter sp. TaxID=1965333 RepID=UPI003784C279
MNSPKAMLQRILPPLGSALLLAAAFLPFKAKRQRLRVVPGVWPAAEPVLLASDMRLLPEDHFQVIEIPWASAVVRAFGSGAADVAVVSLESIMRMQDAGQKLKVLTVLSQSAGADAVLVRPGIARLEDLKGKRVGVERSAGIYLLINALESAGLSLKDIEAVPMFQSEMEAAVQSDLVDAVVATEPWLEKLSHTSSLRSVYDSTQLKVPILHLIVASERSCTASREELVSLLRVQADMAEKFWAGKPFPGMDGALRREKMNTEELAACLRHLRPLSQAENLELLKKLPQMASQVGEQMIRNGIITSFRSDSDWINPSLSEEAFR